MKRILISLVGIFLTFVLNAQEPIELPLWPNGLPNDNGLPNTEEDLKRQPVAWVTQPTLSVYLAPNPNGMAVIMCPGGAYAQISLAHEGHDMARWFNNQGITYAVLKYRMPNGHPDIPLSDAKQAICLMRQHATEWSVNPGQVGIMGASAGGHLAASLANLYDSPEERPDFQVLLYPVISMKDNITHSYSRECLLGNAPGAELIKKYSMEEQANAQTPPTFIVLSTDDGTVTPLNSLLYYQALRQHGVSASLHIYSEGKHGWGFRDSFPYKGLWTQELESWLQHIRRPSLKQQLTVASLPDERWWGGATALGKRMPYASNVELYDLSRQNDNNQVVPLLLSSKGRYVYSSYPFRYCFQNGNLLLESDYEPLTVVQAGSTLKEAYLAASAAYFPPTGNIPEELFFSKPQYNTWIELMYNQNQADIENYARQIINNGFPNGILMIDDNWQNHYGNFDFKPEKFPDPKGMVDRLHQKGFKVMLWVCPYVTPDSPEARYLEEKGYLIKSRGTDAPAIVRWWNGSSACIDLTNPSAFNYLKEQLRQTQEKYGVDGFKFDAGDVMYMCSEDLQFFDPTADAAVYSRKWTEMGLHFPYNEFRAAFGMGGQPLVQRLGDKPYSWDAVSALIPEMQAAGLLGYAYTCPDMIGGGAYTTFLNINKKHFDQELIVRSCQIHAFMPMMQFSVAPWRILDNKHLEICRKFARFHENMGDYLLETARQSARTGEPMVRHMEYEFPGQGFTDCKDQFMIGDTYLVAPMIQKGNSRSVKLPKGKWRDDRGKMHKGGKTIQIDVPIERLPYFERIR